MRANVMGSYWPSKALEGEPEDDLAAYARARLDGKSLDWQWRRADAWICLTPAGAQMPAQGWKLHVSATSRNAKDVLAAVMPILIAEGVPFKFAANRRRVAALNAGDTPRQAAGKFITVYPLDDAQALRLAHACDQATEAHRGPVILSDRPLRPGSLVHYRYGAFAGGTIFDNDGEVIEVIQDPDGKPVRDQRRAWFTPPPWAVDPFAADAAGTTAAASTAATTPAQDGSLPGPAAGRPRPARQGAPVLLNGRYVVRHALKHANKGGVYLAEDRTTGTTVVVKEARPHVEAASIGPEVADVLRHEARVLGMVADLGLTPRPLDLFEQQGHLFLVVERIDGEALRDRVARPVEIAGRALPTEELLGTIRALAEAMDRLHGRGVLIRDFTPSNIMVTPEGDLRLIDLELAHPGEDGPPRPSGAGTPGFASPQQMDGHPSGFPDDYYALGATIAYAATGVPPEFIDDHGVVRPLRTRVAEWIAGAEADGLVSARVCDIVLGCMADDPGQRWGPREVLAALEEPRRNPCGHEPATVTTDQLLEAVDHVNRWLARTVDPAGRHLWPTTCLGMTNDPLNVQAGASGVGVYLCEVARTGPGGEAGGEAETAIRDLVRTATTWVCQVVGAQPERPPGLYFGLAGAVWFLGEAARCLDDPAIGDAAATLALRLPEHTFNPDVTHGTSGIGMAQLHQWTLTGQGRFLERAASAAAAVQSAARRGPHGVVWPVAADVDSTFAGKTLYGFAHGNAGIAYFLLCAAAALGDPSCRDLGLEGLETLMKVAQVRDDGALWEVGDEPSSGWAHWCNGSSGVSTALIRAYAVTGDERYRDRAALGAQAVARARWRSPVVQCHGLAGNAAFLLDMHHFTGDPRFRKMAMELAATIYRRRVYDEGLVVFPDESGRSLAAPFNTGMAGVGSLFLRLVHGGPRPFMTDEFIRAPAMATVSD